MLKLIIIGFWGASVAAGTLFGFTFLRESESRKVHAQEAALEIEYKKSSPVSVPMIEGGRVRGYVVAQFVMGIDKKKAQDVSLPVEIVLSNEAFQTIYEDPSSHLEKPEKYDLERLTQKISKAVNARLGHALVQSVFVEQFTYVSYEDIRNKTRVVNAPQEPPPTKH